MVQTREVGILELAQGAIAEQVEIETSKILANMLDPNTNAKTARKMTITVTFKGDEDRAIVSVEAQAKSSLAPIKPIATKLYIGSGRDGKPQAQEFTRDDPNQIHMFEDNEAPQNVLKLRSV